MSSSSNWVVVSDKECLRYPYRPIDLELSLSDCYNRQKSWLLASYLRHAIRLRDANITPNIEPRLLPTLINMCNDRLQPENFQWLHNLKESPTTIRNGSIFLNLDWISFSDSFLLDSIPDFTNLKQVIVPHYSPHSRRWSVFRVSLRNKIVDGYFLDIFDPTDVEPVTERLKSILELKCPQKRFQFRRRVQIPLSFALDPGTTTFVLASFLHRQGKYLDITWDTVISYKLSYFHSFKRAHDGWLGRFTLSNVTQASHPFVNLAYEGTDDLTDIVDKGFALVDVDGDGNCGFYCLILGLENNDNRSYSPHRIDEAETSMSSSTPWQDSILRLRQSLQEHGLRLLREQYTSYSEHFDFLYLCGVGQEHDIDGLRQNFICPDLPTHRYFEDSFRTQFSDYHMNPNWGAAVFASLLQMRVIVYTRFTRLDRADPSEPIPGKYNWNTTLFKYNAPLGRPDHLQWVEYPYIHRIPDEEYKELPTIEFVLISGFTDSCDKHFIFLRRVICSDVERPTISDDQSLRSILRVQLNNHTASIVAGHDAINPDHIIAENTNDVMDVVPPPIIGAVDVTNHPAVNEEGTMAHTVEEPVVSHLTQIEVPSQHPIDQTSSNEAVDVTNHRVINEEETHDHMGDAPLDPLLIQVNVPSQNEPPVEIPDKQDLVNSMDKMKSLLHRKRKRTRTIFSTQKGRNRRTTKHLNAARQTESRLKYDSNTNRFYTSTYDKETKRYSRCIVQRSIEWINPELVQKAREEPNEWIGPPIGDAGNGVAPANIRTDTPVLYQQHNNPFCFTYSFASALFYCGFVEQAQILSSQATIFAKLHHDAAIKELLHFMLNLAPTIGRPTIYGRRVKSHGTFRRILSWDDVYTTPTPYPTLIIPVLSNGRMSHALTVVDNLIFDSISPQALKACEESVKWIFNDNDVDIYEAFRFCTKCSPRGVKVEGTYRRKMQLA